MRGRRKTSGPSGVGLLRLTGERVVQMNSNFVSVNDFERRNETSGEQRVAANEIELADLMKTCDTHNSCHVISLVLTSSGAVMLHNAYVLTANSNN